MFLRGSGLMLDPCFKVKRSELTMQASYLLYQFKGIGMWNNFLEIIGCDCLTMSDVTCGVTSNITQNPCTSLGGILLYLAEVLRVRVYRVETSNGSVSKMCISGGSQCKTLPILGLRILVHPYQTWMFPLNNIAIKVPKCTKYERNVYSFFRFLVSSQYF